MRAIHVSVRVLRLFARFEPWWPWELRLLKFLFIIIIIIIIIINIIIIIETPTQNISSTVTYHLFVVSERNIQFILFVLYFC